VLNPLPHLYMRKGTTNRLIQIKNFFAYSAAFIQVSESFAIDTK